MGFTCQGAAERTETGQEAEAAPAAAPFGLGSPNLTKMVQSQRRSQTGRRAAQEVGGAVTLAKHVVSTKFARDFVQ